MNRNIPTAPAVAPMFDETPAEQTKLSDLERLSAYLTKTADAMDSNVDDARKAWTATFDDYDHDAERHAYNHLNFISGRVSGVRFALAEIDAMIAGF
jgi:hypothetical protein